MPKTKKTPPRLVVPLSEEQANFLDHHPAPAALIRGLLREWFWRNGQSFPVDQPLGVRKDYHPQQISYWKEVMMSDIMTRSIELLPASPVDLSAVIESHLTALIDDLHRRGVLETYHQLLLDGRQILRDKGYVDLMEWFGLVPIWTDHTRKIIDTFRVKSADED